MIARRYRRKRPLPSPLQRPKHQEELTLRTKPPQALPPLQKNSSKGTKHLLQLEREGKPELLRKKLATLLEGSSKAFEEAEELSAKLRQKSATPQESSTSSSPFPPPLQPSEHQQQKPPLLHDGQLTKANEPWHRVI